MNTYLTIKAFHVAFMVTWFAGLFYLPRLFIYHVDAGDDISQQRFVVMERRLFAIMTIGATLTAICGFALLWMNSSLLSADWFRIKLLTLVLLVVYHLRCLRWMRLLASGASLNSTRWLRWFNEVPTLFLLVIILLAVVKPG